MQSRTWAHALPLLLSLHHSLPLVFPHLLQIPSLPWQPRWQLCPWVTQGTWPKFWQTEWVQEYSRLSVLHNAIIKLIRTILLVSTSGLNLCLLVTLILFLSRDLSSLGLFPWSLLACTIWLLMNLMLLFTTPIRISFQTSELHPVTHLFDIDKKGENKLWRLGDARSYFLYFQYFVWYLYSGYGFVDCNVGMDFNVWIVMLVFLDCDGLWLWYDMV